MKQNLETDKHLRLLKLSTRLRKTFIIFLYTVLSWFPFFSRQTIWRDRVRWGDRIDPRLADGKLPINQIVWYFPWVFRWFQWLLSYYRAGVAGWGVVRETKKRLIDCNCKIPSLTNTPHKSIETNKKEKSIWNSHVHHHLKLPLWTTKQRQTIC